MANRTKSKNPQELREDVIKSLDKAKRKDEEVKRLAKNLFSLGLTMYSRNYSFQSLVYNSLAMSHLDENISLHPEQIKVLGLINSNEGLIFSAPTSFGKTFVIFEHIAREKPQNIVLIVPTLALVEEYKKRIIRKYREIFSEYKVHSSMHEDIEYNFDEKNIFILTHDRVIEKGSYNAIKKIDFLVIDEVYKLQKEESNDRVLILNLAYYHLVNISKKHVLLAPFISGVEKIEELRKKPLFYKTDYSPVVNEVRTYEVMSDKDRPFKALDILKEIKEDEPTLVYFPTITSLGNFVKDNLEKPEGFILEPRIKGFVDWVKSEIYDDWYLVNAMEKGFIVHNGQLPRGIRMYQLDLYEKGEFNKLLCTSTLLEGINTPAKNIIITRPSPFGRKSEFTAFDFFNLVGRSGRLVEHYVGCAHYIKGPEDKEYSKEEAIKKIQFEVTDESEDMDIHKDDYLENKDYLNLIKSLGINHEEYKEKLGSKFRFSTILDLFNNYKKMKERLFLELDKYLKDEKRGRFHLTSLVYEILEGKGNNFYASVINQLLHKGRLSVKEMAEDLLKVESFRKMGVNYVITTILRLKSSYIEHEFYSKMMILLFFMEKERVNLKYLQIMDNKIKSSIDYLYFTDSVHKRMLLDMGIYERDIEGIINIIGAGFKDVTEMVNLLKANKRKFGGISIISKFVIDSLD